MSTSTTGPSARRRQRWLARLVSSLLGMLAVVAAPRVRLAARTVAAPAGGARPGRGRRVDVRFLAHRGCVRLLALALLVATPLVWSWLFVAAGLLGPARSSCSPCGLARRAGTGRARGGQPTTTAMPEYEVPPPRHPFLVMNPRSGGGKVGRFGLKEKAEALGAEVLLLEGPDRRRGRARPRTPWPGARTCSGSPAATGRRRSSPAWPPSMDVPFLVISAGTRNHFALDLGLDRRGPVDVPRGAHRGRRRAARRPRHGRGPHLREQRVVRRVRRDGAEPGLPRRQEPDDAAAPSRPAQRARRAPPHRARGRRRRRPPAGGAGQRQPLRHGRPGRDGAPGPPGHGAARPGGGDRRRRRARGRAAARRQRPRTDLAGGRGGRRRPPTPRRSRSASTARRSSCRPRCAARSAPGRSGSGSRATARACPGSGPLGAGRAPRLASFSPRGRSR